MTSSTPTGQDFEAAREAAWQAAVTALTQGARLTGPGQRPVDFADFLASALAAVAANLGGVDRLLAGRPGSWEADLVDQLVHGTVGHDDAGLTEYRTEPIVIHLNVARLVEEAEEVNGREAIAPYEREWMAVEDHYAALDDDQDHSDAEEAALAALRDRWAGEYARFAEAFTAAVLAQAAAIPGLTVPVTVEATTDPDARTDRGLPHPGGWDDPDPDPLVWRLWCAALDTTPLPTHDDAPHDAGPDDAEAQP